MGERKYEFQIVDLPKEIKLRAYGKRKNEKLFDLVEALKVMSIDRCIRTDLAELGYKNFMVFKHMLEKEGRRYGMRLGIEQVKDGSIEVWLRRSLIAKFKRLED